MSSQPWVSFCIATYRRPTRLAEILNNISQQTVQDYEVIVSDNDPQQSSREVVESLRDPRLKYFANAQNVGMVKNFNIALSHATGEYVVMITDDDPLYPHMLSTLRGLVQKYPGHGAYYGACEVLLENKEVADTYQSAVGKRSFLAPEPPDSVREYSSAQFLEAFFNRRIFSYMLWSTGIVRRDIAVGIGGMPDYGSPFLTDFAYMSLAGEKAGFVAVNSVLGYQAIHGQNSGFSDPHALRQALQGSHGYISERLSGRSDWPAVRGWMEKYLAVYAIAHVVAMQRHVRLGGAAQQHAGAQESFGALLSIPYVKRQRFRYYALKVLDTVPLARTWYDYLKRARQRVGRPWLKAS